MALLKVYQRMAADMPQILRSNLTLSVPSQFGDINLALDWLNDKAISPDATVTIQVAAGTYVYTSSIKPAHPNGDRIQILGSGSGTCMLRFQECMGFEIYDGNRIGKINAMTIDGYNKQGRVFDPLLDMQGVNLLRGSYATVGPDVIVQEFSRCGLLTYQGCTLVADGVISRSNGSDGFVASQNSNVSAVGAVSTLNEGSGFYCERASTLYCPQADAISNPGDNHTGTLRGGDGFTCLFGGTIWAGDNTITGNGARGIYASTYCTVYAGSSTITGNANVGAMALNGAVVRSESSTISTNGSHGVYAENGGVMRINGSTIAGNTGHGVRAEKGSQISAESCVLSANTSGGFYIASGSSATASATTTTGASNGFTAIGNSSIDAPGATANLHAANGFTATNHSFINAAGATATNCNKGFTAFLGSAMDATTTTYSGNTTADFEPVINTIASRNSYIYG